MSPEPRDDITRVRLEADRWHETAEQERQHVQTMFQELRNLADRHAELQADRARLENQIAADAEHRARLGMEVAGLKSELKQDRARIAALTAEGHHQADEIDRLQAKLARPWWRQLLRGSFH